MVRRGRRALDRKLLRDLVAMRGQVTAIALVVAAGVAVFCAYLSNFDSLRRTEQRFYERQRFADVFAQARRAPRSLLARIAEIPGVAVVEDRVVAAVTLDVPNLDEPASGRLVSVPGRGRPRLNDLVLVTGRWPDPAQGDEVLINEAFAAANHLRPSSTLAALLNGRRRELTVVGVALSPEYVYTIRPGEILPNDRRFGVLWMERRALAAAFDLEGGFNDVSLRLAPGASLDGVIADLDRLLEPMGGYGAIPRSQQSSAWMLGNELRQLASFGVVLPAIFLGVAAFVLHVALTRALSVQRPQIATLKALGYSNRAIGAHYRAWALWTTGAGALCGVGIGAWMGSGMINMYNEYFKFPSLDYRLSATVAVGAILVSLATAELGARRAVRRAVSLPPAEAMRPAPPARYRPSAIERAGWIRRLRWRQTSRIIWRNLERQPGRAGSSVLGIACGGAIVFLGLTFLDSIDQIISTQFDRAQRQDVTVSLVETRGAGAFQELRRFPGVVDAEPFRAVPARFVSGSRHRNGSLLGVSADARLERLVSRDGEVLALPPAGLVLSRRLAERLRVGPGDRLRVEILDGRRPAVAVPVAATVDDTMGLGAWLEIGALRRLLGEEDTISGAQLALDARRRPAFHAAIRSTPGVAGAAFLDAALESFRATLAEHLWLTLALIVGFASVIAGGVIYNTARVSLSERQHELSTLRVLGFRRAEISMVLLGELALLVLVALPVGALLGAGLAQTSMVFFDSDVFRIPLVLRPQTFARSALVVLAAALGSGLAVRHRLDHLDLIGVLKTSE